MRCLRIPLVPFRSLALLCILWSYADLSAQENEGDLVYKFAVQGVDAPEVAKAVQVVLLQEASTTSCAFIDEADRFRLATSATNTYASLRSLLHANGYTLAGAVEVSDGTVLCMPQTTTDHQ